MAKKVLVTGGAGYIGSHVVRLLAEKGYHPIVLDNLSTGHRKLVDGHELVEVDIGDTQKLAKILKVNKVEAVMNFASYIAVGESVEKPLKYYDNNVSRTLALLQTLVEHDVRHFIFSSSAAVYGTPETDLIDELHPLQPINPYGLTKYLIERVLQDLDQAHGFKSAFLRYFNAAGAHPSGELGELHEPETHLIPLAIRATLPGDFELTVYGNDYDTKDGTCVRDYVHVCDLADAHILALERLLNKGDSLIYNLGNGNGFSVLEVLASLEKVAGQKPRHRIGERRAGDATVLVASSEKAKRELGWKPQFAGLDEIVKSAWDFESNRER